MPKITNIYEKEFIFFAKLYHIPEYNSFSLIAFKFCPQILAGCSVDDFEGWRSLTTVFRPWEDRPQYPDFSPNGVNSWTKVQEGGAHSPGVKTPG
jgi:hypothetical protein